MKGTKAASRYAKALLDLAIENNKLESVVADMAYLMETSEDSIEFGAFLRSPIVNSEKKIAILNSIFGQFDEITARFINLVTKNRREALLPDIAFSFSAQVKEYKGIVPLTLVSAAPLSESTKAEILKKIGQKVKGELELTEKIDQDLIGGFIVRMGDTQIDASVASQFSNLKQRLTR
jgi:F-type H+-transporting ATPase subunit delta